MAKEEYVVVWAPTKAGENFIKLLKFKGVKVAGITNSQVGKSRLEELGIEHCILADTSHPNTWNLPPFPVGRVYLFESSLTLCCRYIQMCRSWTRKPIFVITTSINPRLVYKGLGAKYIIYSHSGDVAFLADKSALLE